MSYLTKFEKVRVLGTRAKHLSEGAPSTVDTTGLTNALDIAKKNSKKINYLLLFKEFIQVERLLMFLLWKWL